MCINPQLKRVQSKCAVHFILSNIWQKLHCPFVICPDIISYYGSTAKKQLFKMDLPLRKQSSIISCLECAVKKASSYQHKCRFGIFMYLCFSDIVTRQHFRMLRSNTLPLHNKQGSLVHKGYSVKPNNLL